MGKLFFDQYSILHFSVGVMFYFWHADLKTTLILHTIFEIVENTTFGMNDIIKKYFKNWPGGKSEPDNLLNSIGDTVFVTLGWLAAKYLDKFADYYKLNKSTILN